MKNLFVLLILATVLLSCGKKNTVKVQGRCVNPVTGEGFENVRVKLFVKKNLDIPGGSIEIAATTTDANGNFYLEAKNRKDIFIQMDSYLENHHELGWYVNNQYRATNYIQAEKNATMQPEYRAVPYGNLRFHLHNQNCQGPNDILQLYFDGAQIPFGSQEGLLVTQTGCINILGNPIQYPMGYRYYHWVVNRNGVIQTFYDTIFLNANETQILEVFY